MPSTTFTTSTTTRSSSRGVAGQSSSFFQPSLILKPKPFERTSSGIFAGLDVDRIPDIGQGKRTYSPFPSFFDDRSSAGFLPGGSFFSETREPRPTKSSRFGTERRGTPTVGSRMAFENTSSLGRWEEGAERYFKPGDEFTSPSLEMLVQEYGPASPQYTDDDEDLASEISGTDRSRHSMRNRDEFKVQHQTARKPAAQMHNTRIDGFIQQDRSGDLAHGRGAVNSPVNLSKVQPQIPRKSPAPMHDTRVDDFVQDRRDYLVQDQHVNSHVNLSNAPHHTSPNYGRLPRAAKSRALTARELLAGKTNRPDLMNDPVIYCSSGNRRAPVKAVPKLRSSCPSDALPAQSRAKKVTQPRHPKMTSSHATQSTALTERHPLFPPRHPDSEHTMRTRSAWRCPYDHCHYKTGIPEDAHAHYATHTETRGSASRSSARGAAYH